MMAFQSAVLSRVLPLQSVKSGNVAGASNPRRVSSWPTPFGPWHPIQDALKISSPVSSFKPLVDACCEAVGCFWAVRMIGTNRTISRRTTRSPNFMRRRIHQILQGLAALFQARISKENGNHSQNKWGQRAVAEVMIISPGNPTLTLGFVVEIF